MGSNIQPHGEIFPRQAYGNTLACQGYEPVALLLISYSYRQSIIN